MEAARQWQQKTTRPLERREPVDQEHEHEQHEVEHGAETSEPEIVESVPFNRLGRKFELSTDEQN
jgi:hypothetical protein